MPPGQEPDSKKLRAQLHRERWRLLRRIDRLTDPYMVALSFVWLGLLIYDLTVGLSPDLQLLSNVIWVLFILDFLLSFTLAPDKWRYLRTNWLTALSLLLPALRILRVFRIFRALRFLRAARPLNLLRLLTSLNRGFRALGRTVRRRGLPYVILLTAIVTFAGAAGMFAFEGGGFHNYWDALWWTAMLMTSLGGAYSPVTPEGRVLTFVLAVYAFAIFGYITAAVASFFVGQDREERREAGGGERLRADIAALRQELAAFRQEAGGDAGAARYTPNER